MHEPIEKLASEWAIVRGLSIHARVSINPVPAEAPSIIMVHGLVVSSRYMVPTALRLAPYYHIYAPDLPGFGKSSKPSHVLNSIELADFLADWMQTIGLKQATHAITNGSPVQLTRVVRAFLNVDRAEDRDTASSTANPPC